MLVVLVVLWVGLRVQVVLCVLTIFCVVGFGFWGVRVFVGIGERIEHASYFH